MTWPAITPPFAPRTSAMRKQHDIHIADPYAWLRDPDWQDVVREPEKLAPAIRKHLLRENEYADKILQDTASLQLELLAEMKDRIAPDEAEVPVKDGQWAYGSRYEPGAEYPLFVRYGVSKTGKVQKHKEQVLLQGPVEAQDHAFFDLGEFQHSPDHSKIAWSVDLFGSEYYSLFVRELATGKTTHTGIKNAGSGFLWSSDSQHLLWIWRDEQSRPRQVRLHKTGTSSATDITIYEEQDDGFFLSLSATSDQQYALFGAHDHETSEIWSWPLDGSQEIPACIAPRQTGIEYEVEHRNGYFTILSNVNDAKDFQILRMKAGSSMSVAQMLVPHQPGRLILQQIQFRDFHVRLERENALPRIIIRDEKTGHETALAFEEPAYALGLVEGLSFAEPFLRLCISSPVRPRRVLDVHMKTNERILQQEQQIPSGHDPSHYVCERVFAPTGDGDTVPLTILRHKSTPVNGTAPLLLYGYGAYGLAMPASFSANRLSLVDRGMIYVIAHVRGGMEKGYAWYEAAKRENKQNTFSDFIASARFLIASNYTAKRRIIAHGGSAGGMLVGAVVNQQPDLFAGILAQVPFVDVLTTMSDAGLPLTPPEWPEWGNPLGSKQDFARIKSYCPISNVRDLTYPPIYATAGISDTRVTWWEPAKWIASLRHAAPKAGPYILKTEMSAGHGGASGRYGALVETADLYAFALKCAAIASQ